MTNKTEAQEALTEVVEQVSVYRDTCIDNIYESPDLAEEIIRFVETVDKHQETIRKALTVLDTVEKLLPELEKSLWNENMDEAPRDGTPILVRKKTDIYDFIIGSSYWIEDDLIGGGWLSIGLMHINEQRIDLGLSNPDEWQPLPTPEQQEILAKIKEMIDAS